MIATPVPVETVTPIAPSQAIRLGCLTTTQAFGYGLNHDATAACALGALYLGGFKGPLISLRDIKSCPAADCSSDVYGAIAVIHLNDEHRWSRERIADWLESLGL